MDAGPVDAGPVDAGPVDAGPPDAGPVDAGPTLPQVCPLAVGAAPMIGDFNSDGVYDVADSVAAASRMYRGGHGPACLGTVDFREDGHFEIDDATALRGELTAGIHIPPVADGGCGADSTPWSNGPCVALAASLVAPAQVPPGQFEVQFTLDSRASIIQGWSASMRATGCRIVSSSLEGTVSADVSAQPPGIRHLGYGQALVTDGGAFAYTELSLIEDIKLPAQPTTVAKLKVEADDPGTGCSPCQVSLGSGLRWTGQPLDLAVAIGGYSYRPPTVTATVQVCHTP